MIRIRLADFTVEDARLVGRPRLRDSIEEGLRWIARAER